MKKKTLSLLLATVLFSNALPLKSFAVEIQQEPLESSEQVQEVETSTSESAIQESSNQEVPQTTETTESSNETVSSENEIVTEASEQLPAEVIQEVAVPSEAVSATEALPIHFDKNETTETFIAKVGEEARFVGFENNLFASVMIAQAILESGSGSSTLSQEPYNNLFGIKGDYQGQSVTFETAEDDGTGSMYQIQSAFRQYPSVKESFEDYATLLKDGVSWNPGIYQGTWKDHAETYENATEALTGTYASDTLYNQKLNSLIETYDLTQYDHEKGSTIVGGDFEPYNNVNYDSGNSYAAGNCTQFVYNRITQLGGHVELNMGNGADWGITGRARGYEVTNTPKAGTAVSFAPGVLGADPEYGHVAFCEKVNEDGSILISEMNAVGLGVVSTRIISAEFVSLLTYITPK